MRKIRRTGFASTTTPTENHFLDEPHNHRNLEPFNKRINPISPTETRQDSDRKPLLMQLDQERHIPPRLRPRPIGGSKTNHKPYRIKRKPEKPPLSESLQPSRSKTREKYIWAHIEHQKPNTKKRKEVYKTSDLLRKG